MKNVILVWLICSALVASGVELYPGFTQEEARAEFFGMMTSVNHGTGLAWRAAVIRQMLKEANTVANQLDLPIKRPIQVTDIYSDFISGPWNGVAGYTGDDHWWYPNTIFGTNIYNPHIPRVERLRALKIGVDGVIAAGEFEFAFTQGGLTRITRMDGPQTERYANRLDELIGKPSLIDTNGAYELAKHWLAILGVDVFALENPSVQFNLFGQPIHGGHTISQGRYLPLNATNVVTLPIYHVNFGSQHFPADPKSNLRAFDSPLTTVEILGTTKELQEIIIGENTLSRIPLPYYHGRLFLITNALELLHTPNPTPEELQNPVTAQAYILTPQQVSSYARNYYASARTNASGHVYYRLSLSTNQNR